MRPIRSSIIRSNSPIPWYAAAILAAAFLWLGNWMSRPVGTDQHYRIWGTVRYEDGRPADTVKVVLTVAQVRTIQETVTDHKGRYVLLIQAGHEDLGNALTMKVDDQSKVLQILFNPNDRADNRGQRVDFVVPSKH